MRAVSLSLILSLIIFDTLQLSCLKDKALPHFSLLLSFFNMQVQHVERLTNYAAHIMDFISPLVYTLP
jgi:hypothetical protein